MTERPRAGTVPAPSCRAARQPELVHRNRAIAVSDPGHDPTTKRSCSSSTPVKLAGSRAAFIQTRGNKRKRNPRPCQLRLGLTSQGMSEQRRISCFEYFRSRKPRYQYRPHSAARCPTRSQLMLWVRQEQTAMGPEREACNGLRSSADGLIHEQSRFIQPFGSILVARGNFGRSNFINYLKSLAGAGGEVTGSRRSFNMLIPKGLSGGPENRRRRYGTVRWYSQGR